MARTAAEIRSALANSVRSADPTADLDKDAIFNFLLAPVAPELAETETKQDRLAKLVSLQLPDAATSDEIKAIGTSFGLAPLKGKFATCRQTFFTYSQPTNAIVIPRGTLVGTTDGSIVFTVDEQVTLPAGTAAAPYFVASKRRYEIKARIVATASGVNYNLPSYRINKIFSNLSGIDGTENQEPSTGGLLQQAQTDYFTRIQAKFSGLNPESGGGITTSVRELFPDYVQDVVIAYPKDRGIFFRDISRPALDVYVLGTQQKQVTKIFTPTPNSFPTTIPLDFSPVLTVDSVVKNNVTITDFAFLPDTTLQYQRSARATEQVVLSAALQNTDVVSVTYTYNSVIYDSQQILFENNSQMFDTDILCRMPLEIPITIDVAVTALPSFDPTRISNALISQIYSYCGPFKFVDMLLPEVLRDNILYNVPGISAVYINKFTRTYLGAAPVESISFSKNEIPTVDVATLVSKVRQ